MKGFFAPYTKLSKELTIEEEIDNTVLEESGDMLKVCSICEQPLADSQMIACFAICEHSIHEECLFELIQSGDYNRANGNQRNGEEQVFCPCCVHSFNKTHQ